MGTAGAGEGGMNRGKSTEMHSSLFVKLDSRGNVLFDAGSSNPELCDNMDGWDGMGVGGRLETAGAGGRGSRGIPMADS